MPNWRGVNAPSMTIVQNSNDDSALRIKNSAGDYVYISAANVSGKPQISLSAGGKRSGGLWNADETEAGVLTVSASTGSAFAFASNTGLTAGNLFFPGTKFEFDQTSGLLSMTGNYFVLSDRYYAREGADDMSGVVTLVAGTATVTTPASCIKATSRILLTVNNPNGGTVGVPYVSARTPGTSFVITSSAGAADVSDVAYEIFNAS